MKLKRVMKNLILLVISKHELLKRISIAQDKVFVHVKGSDKDKMEIHHPRFQILNLQNKNIKKIKKNEEPTLTLQAFILSMPYYRGEENFDSPFAFNRPIIFN